MGSFELVPNYFRCWKDVSHGLTVHGQLRFLLGFAPVLPLPCHWFSKNHLETPTLMPRGCPYIASGASPWDVRTGRPSATEELSLEYSSHLAPGHLWPLTSYSEDPLPAFPNLLMMKCQICFRGLSPWPFSNSNCFWVISVPFMAVANGSQLSTFPAVTHPGFFPF